MAGFSENVNNTAQIWLEFVLILTMYRTMTHCYRDSMEAKNPKIVSQVLLSLNCTILRESESAHIVQYFAISEPGSS